MIVKLTYQEGIRQNEVKVTRKEWDKLEPGEYLNDVLIQFWLKFYTHYVHKHTVRAADKFHIFDPQFYTKLQGQMGQGIEYSTVRRWTKKVNLFQQDWICVPVC